MSDPSIISSDEVVSDFVEACGGFGAMKNLMIIYKIIALINAEKDAIAEKEDIFYDDSRNSYIQENEFFDELRNSIYNVDGRPAILLEPHIVSGYLYLQVDNEEWQRMLIVVQKGIIKCYDSERKWKRSIYLRDCEHKMTQENLIYLTSSKENDDIVFENREENSLTYKKWTVSFQAHIDYAKSLSNEELDLVYDRSKNRASIVTANTNPNPAPAHTPQISSILAELRSHLIQTIRQGLEEGAEDSKAEEYKLGLKSALGKLYQSEDNYVKAEELFKESFETRQKLLGPDHFFTISSMDDLVELYCITKAYDKAVVLLGEILNIRKEKLGNAHPATLVCMNNLAYIYEHLGQSVKSELMYRECCELFVTEYGTDHPHSLLAMKNLAYLFYKHQKYDFAEEVFRGCYEQQFELLGADHADTFTLMRNLLNVYIQLERYEEIKNMYPQALDCLRIREEKLGIEHSSSISALNLVAFLAMTIGRTEEAEKRYIEVVKFRKLKLGVSHPETLSSIHNLASLYFNNGKYSQALPLFSTILEQVRKSQKSGIDNGTNKSSALIVCISNLANTYYNLQDYGKAEALYNEMFRLFEVIEQSSQGTVARYSDPDNTLKNSSRLPSPDSPTKRTLYSSNRFDPELGNSIDMIQPFILTSYSNLANIYFRQKKYDLAEPLFVRCVDTRKATLGLEHVDTLTSLKNLGVFYQTVKRDEEATEAFITCYEGRKKLLGESHADTLIAMSYLSNMYNQQKIFDKAEPLYSQYLLLTAGQSMDDTSCVITNNLGIIYYRTKSLEKARPLLEQVAEYKKSQLGSENPNTLFCQGNLASVYKSLKEYALAEPLYVNIYEAKKKALGEEHAETVTALNNLKVVRSFM